MNYLLRTIAAIERLVGLISTYGKLEPSRERLNRRWQAGRFALLDHDILTVSAEEVSDTKVLGTVVGRKTAWFTALKSPIVFRAKEIGSVERSNPTRFGCNGPGPKTVRSDAEQS